MPSVLSSIPSARSSRPESPIDEGEGNADSNGDGGGEGDGEGEEDEYGGMDLNAELDDMDKDVGNTVKHHHRGGRL